MRKKIILIIYLVIGLAITFVSTDKAYSEEIEQDQNFYYTCFVKKELTDEAKQLNIFLAKYFDALESHNSEILEKLYADEYVSGDGFEREKMISIIKDSWDLSPDLDYSGDIQDIKFDSAFAMIEINENLTGITKEKSEITGDKGLIESSSKSVLYLNKYGKGWQIITDKTLYEETSIKYGEAKDLDISIYAPGQVFPADSYTISLKTDIPENMFAVGSIISEPLIYPRKKSEEVFRQVPMDVQLLERVVQANNNSLNELAVASVSYCDVKKDDYKRPEIDLAGTAILIKRVNVVNVLASEK